MSWVETARLTVEKIKKKREETVVVQEAEEWVSDIDCERSELREKRFVSINKATRLLRERGWIQIWAGYLNQHIYLVRDEKVKVPDPALSKYTQGEVEALKDLTIEEIQTLHEAKIIFKGIISDKKP